MYFIIDTANCTCETPTDSSNEAYAVLLALVVPPVNVSGRETEVSDGRVSLLYASVVALEELESSLLFLAHEMMVKVKKEIRIICKIYFT
jgi:hypothetical protein